MYSYLNQVYGGYFGAIVSTLGNPDLRGQKTYNRNIGIEGTLFNKHLNFEFNFYNNSTKGNLTSITIAPSIGFSSYKTNMGNLTNRGMEFSLSYVAVRNKDMLLSFSLNGARNHNRIEKISDALQAYNRMLRTAVLQVLFSFSRKASL